MTIQKSFMKQSLDDLLADWYDPLGSNTMSDAEDLISALQIELAGEGAIVMRLQCAEALLDKIASTGFLTIGYGSGVTHKEICREYEKFNEVYL